MLVDETDVDVINELISSLNPSQFKGITSRLKNSYPDLYSKLLRIKETLNLDTISECVYLVINGLECSPECEGVNKKCTKKLTFKGLNEGYTHYCKHCSSSSEEFKMKREETNMEKYGKIYPTQNTAVKNKIRETTLRKYGVDNPKKINVPFVKRIKTKLSPIKDDKLVLNLKIGQK